MARVSGGVHVEDIVERLDVLPPRGRHPLVSDRESASSHRGASARADEIIAEKRTHLSSRQARAQAILEEGPVASTTVV